jgi:hypothetical protein
MTSCSPVDAALAKLAEHDPLKARLVELRFFAGLTGDQAAEALGISPSTADRLWAFSRACCVANWASARTTRQKSETNRGAAEAVSSHGRIEGG